VLTRAVLVESERKVAGDVFFKKGHTPRDLRRSVSMAWVKGQLGVVFCGWFAGSRNFVEVIKKGEMWGEIEALSL